MTVLPAGSEVDYTVTWLEMTDCPSYDWPTLPLGTPASLIHAPKPPRWYFLALYEAVGRDYAWEDAPQVPAGELEVWLQEAKDLYTLIRDGVPAGFFLLNRSKPDETDLAYFGLVPEAVGQGLGTYLLRTAILTAWSRDDIQRLTVNTCTLDHPRALSHYQRNGFMPVRQESFTRVLQRPRDLARIPD